MFSVFYIATSYPITLLQGHQFDDLRRGGSSHLSFFGNTFFFPERNKYHTISK